MPQGSTHISQLAHRCTKERKHLVCTYGEGPVGPPHLPVWSVELTGAAGVGAFQGKGASKKEAVRKAAEKALDAFQDLSTRTVNVR